MGAAESGTATRARLLKAAAACFAARGFHGTTIREIADRARVNVAAGHYHVGSKRDLYLAVLREQFALVREQLRASGADVDAAALAGLPRPALQALLERRLRAMLAFLLGPPPSVHGTLMQREMCDPSDALPLIVAEFVAPFTAELQALVARLAPELSAAEVERATLSILGQSLFYRFAMPIVHARWGSWSPELTETLAAHIAAFSEGGIERLRRAKRRGRRSRAR
jgi:AcrR family transcriptional regulator